MTRKSKTGETRASAADAAKRGRHRFVGAASTGGWLLQDAKARFSELVRKAKTDGPQLVTVHGRESVFVVAAEEFRRLKGKATGQALIDALQASPSREVEIAPARGPAPVRDVLL